MHDEEDKEFNVIKEYRIIQSSFFFIQITLANFFVTQLFLKKKKISIWQLEMTANEKWHKRVESNLQL